VTNESAMQNPDPIRAVDYEKAEAEAQTALDRSRRERIATSTQEFVSDRDALEDAWTGSGESSARDEGW
jgi:hypothetical protein